MSKFTPHKETHINQESYSNVLASIWLTRSGRMSQTSAWNDKVTATMSFFHSQAITVKQTHRMFAAFTSS